MMMASFAAQLFSYICGFYYFTIALSAEGQVYVIIQHVLTYGGRHLRFITINIVPKSWF